MESKALLYGVILDSGHAAAAFAAMTPHEAAERAKLVAQALGISGPWKVGRLDAREPGVPWFKEDYFALLALSRNQFS